MSIINLLISPLGVGGPVIADLTVFDLDRPRWPWIVNSFRAVSSSLHFDRGQINLSRR